MPRDPWPSRRRSRLESIFVWSGIGAGGEFGLLPPPLAGEGWGGGERVQMSLFACPLDLVACPLPIPPAEVGYIRLRPIKTGRTRVNPSSAASGGGNAPSARRRLQAQRTCVTPSV